MSLSFPIVIVYDIKKEQKEARNFVTIRQVVGLVVGAQIGISRTI